MHSQIHESVIRLSPAPAIPQPKRGKRFLLAIIAAGVLVGGGGWWLWKSQAQSKELTRQSEHGDAENGKGVPGTTKVEVIVPRVGGVERVCVQPGSVEPFESADLYAKVSGFLARPRPGDSDIRIGTRVTKGQLLARLDVPELVSQVRRDEAKLEHDKARVSQMEAHVVAAEADAKAAAIAMPLARTVFNAKTAYRKYRDKELARLSQLDRENAIERKVVEESQDHRESSVEAEVAAKEGIALAESKAAAAVARVAQARADLEEARASVKVTAADLERSRVFLAYTEIRSPFDGVVTKRNFDPGAFIRSADSGGERMPVYSVERTDLMLVVVQVTDRDVPFVDVGDPAVIETDALPGSGIHTTVARKASSEDSATRTMRTEFDVPNPDGKLSRGMYGRVTIKLQAGKPDALTIPSAALVGKAELSAGSVRVVRDGVIRKVPVRLGADNGIEVEVVSGLTASDRVVLKANGPVDDGTRVTAVETKTSRGH